MLIDFMLMFINSLVNAILLKYYGSFVLFLLTFQLSKIKFPSLGKLIYEVQMMSVVKGLTACLGYD